MLELRLRLYCTRFASVYKGPCSQPYKMANLQIFTCCTGKGRVIFSPAFTIYLGPVHISSWCIKGEGIVTTIVSTLFIHHYTTYNEYQLLHVFACRISHSIILSIPKIGKLINLKPSTSKQNLIPCWVNWINTTMLFWCILLTDSFNKQIYWTQLMNRR